MKQFPVILFPLEEHSFKIFDPVIPVIENDRWLLYKFPRKCKRIHNEKALQVIDINSLLEVQPG
jgi:hypothetical protein